MAFTAAAAIIGAVAAIGAGTYSAVQQREAQKKQKEQFEESQGEAHKQEVFQTAGDVVRDTRDMHVPEERALQSILDETKSFLGK